MTQVNERDGDLLSKRAARTLPSPKRGGSRKRNKRDPGDDAARRNACDTLWGDSYMAMVPKGGCCYRERGQDRCGAAGRRHAGLLPPPLFLASKTCLLAGRSLARSQLQVEKGEGEEQYEPT